MGDFQIQVIPDLQSIIVTAITLTLLYIIYKKFLYVPVSMFLQERRNLIQSEIKDAQELKKDARQIKENQEAILSGARLEGQEIVENARKYGEEVKDSIIIEAKKEAKEIIVKAEREVERQKQLLLVEMKNQSVDMGILIASKIMEEEINIDKQNFLIDKFIDEVGNSKWQS